jgi:hypothetical protein
MGAFAIALGAAAYVGWLSAVDRWLEPWLRRLVARVLDIRIEAARLSVGLLKARTWTTVPPSHGRASVVVVIGAISALLVAVVPAVGLAVLVAHARLAPRLSATLTLVSVLTGPIGVLAHVIGEGPRS